AEMAYTQPLFYNVNRPVGPDPDCNQDPSDVMLVQFLLGQWANNNRGLFEQVRRAGLDSTMPVTGKFDRNLWGWINGFHMLNHQHQDGRVDPAKRDPQELSGRGQPYAIVLLNVDLKRFSRDRFFNLPNDPALPIQLRSALFNGFA